MIASFFVLSVFQNRGHMEKDGFASEDIYVEFGEGPLELNNEEVQQRIVEARKARLSQKEVRDVKNLIDNHETIFRFRLGKGKPRIF